MRRKVRQAFETFNANNMKSKSDKICRADLNYEEMQNANEIFRLQAKLEDAQRPT